MAVQSTFRIWNNEEAPVNADPQSLWFRQDIEAVVLGIKNTGVLSGGVVTQEGTPDRRVNVTAGTGRNGGALVTWIATDVTLNNADATLDRIDMIVVDSGGTVTKRTGTAAAHADPADYTAGDIPIAFVYLPGGTSTVITNYITDKRVFLSLPNVAQVAGGAAITKTDDTNVTLTLGGTPATAALVATSFTLGWTGVLSVARGGIGIGTLASNGVLYGNGTGAVQALAVNSSATNKFLTQASSGAPAWNLIVAGDLPNNAANPSASLGLAAINGSATTWMRSDAAPALNQGITPTWTGLHLHSGAAVRMDQYLRVGSTSAPATTSAGYISTVNLLVGTDKLFPGEAIAMAINGAAPAGANGHLYIEDTETMAAGAGGRIVFGGRYQNPGAGGAATSWAAIQGQKEDGTSGNFGGNLILQPRANGGGAFTDVAGAYASGSSFRVVGYERVGSLAAPVNVTAGDFTAIRGQFGANTALLTGVTLANNGGYFTTYVNSQTRPVSDAGMAVGWNYSSGLGEVGLWNIYEAANVSGFVFKQKTGASTHIDLFTITGVGNALNAGYSRVGSAVSTPANTTAGDFTAVRANIGVDTAMSTVNGLTASLQVVGAIMQFGTFTTASGGATTYYLNTTLNGAGDGPNGFLLQCVFSPSANINTAYGYLGAPFFSPPSGVTIAAGIGFFTENVYGAVSGAVTVGSTMRLGTPVKAGSMVPTTQYGLEVVDQFVSGMTTVAAARLVRPSGGGQYFFSLGSAQSASAMGAVAGVMKVYNEATAAVCYIPFYSSFAP